MTLLGHESVSFPTTVFFLISAPSAYEMEVNSLLFYSFLSVTEFSVAEYDLTPFGVVVV